jgi:hypothetical protein
MEETATYTTDQEVFTPAIQAGQAAMATTLAEADVEAVAAQTQFATARVEL